eukprot:scaffold10658_cov101-Skeletonema_marinoi.AAC.7
MTEGWHYLTYTDCNDDGWIGFGGQDGTVDIDMKYKGKLGYASKSSRGGSKFVSMVSASYNIGNVGEELLMLAARLNLALQGIARQYTL